MGWGGGDYLRHLRFGQDATETTTKAYAQSLVLYLCSRSSRSVTGRPGPVERLDQGQGAGGSGERHPGVVDGGVEILQAERHPGAFAEGCHPLQGTGRGQPHRPGDPVDRPHRQPLVVQPGPVRVQAGAYVADTLTDDAAELLATAERSIAVAEWLGERRRVASCGADRGPAHRATLTERLSEVLGEQVFHDAGLTPTNEIANLRKRVAELEQQLLDHKQDLQDRDDELAAARAANRDLITTLNRPVR
jgi:hypothetical protein